MQLMKICKALLIILLLVLIIWYPSNAISEPLDSVRFHVSILNNLDPKFADEQVIDGSLDDYFKTTNFSDEPTTNFVWLKIDILNNTIHSDWILQFEGQNQYIEVYYNNNEELTGSFVPVNERSVSNDYGRNAVNIYFVDSSRSIYAKVYKANYKNWIPLVHFYRPANWLANEIKYRSETNLGLGLYLGASLFACIALTFFFFSTRDRTYLFYSIYLFFGAIYTVGSLGYYWFLIGDIPKFFPLIESFTLAVFYISFIQFIQYYFNLKETHKLWYKVFNIISIVYVFHFTLRLLFPNYELIRSVIIISIALLTIVFFIKLLLEKNPIVYYVFGGVIVFFLSVITSVLLYNFRVNILRLENIVMFGIVFQIVLFSMGLAIRMKLLLEESQDAKDALILQLEENQKIQREINEQLERKVKLRTKEISKQKEEIQDKAKELEIANEEVRLMNENLEREVLSRTEHIKLQNKKLIDYAFRNAHHIRGPLARILGLLNLIRLDKENNELQKFYIDSLEISAHELDASIKKSSKLLEEDFNKSPKNIN